MGKVIVKCDWCGVDLERYSYLVNKTNFCSPKCHGEWDKVNSVRIIRGVIESKICYRCKEEKDVSEFKIIRVREDGLIRYSSNCKKCSTEESMFKRYFRNNSSCQWYPPGIKKCSLCKEEKPYEEFSPHAATKDGRGSRCKECVAKITREKRQSNTESGREYQRNYYKNNKEKIAKTAKKFRDKNREILNQKTREWHSKNRDHNKEYCKTYYQENLKYMLDKNKRWRQENPERARELRRIYRNRKLNADGFHSNEEWIALLTLFGFKCIVCGSKEDMTEDHIFPLSIGGSDDICNIQPMCKSCNSSKHIDCFDYRPVTDMFILTKMYIEGE